jgi:CIC family chloride channel protein
MLTVVIAHLVAKRLEPDNLYSGWLRRRGEDISHGADRDVLAGLRVTDVCEPAGETVPEHAPAATLLARLGAAPAGQTLVFPVVDAERRLVGMITVLDLGRAAAEAAEHPERIRHLTAGDLAATVDPLAPDDSLLEAVRRMGVRGSPSLPVADPASGRLIGIVTRAHVIAAYERTVARHRG